MTTRRPPLPSFYLLFAAALVLDVVTAFAPTATTPAAKDLRLHLSIDPENRSSPLEPRKSPQTKTDNGRENDKAKDAGAHPGYVQGLTDTETCSSCIPENVSAKTKKRLERLLSPRPHPVFLLEKATKIAEDSLGGAMSMLLPDKHTSSTSADDASDKVKEKKKLVILGSGWGCAAMVQDRDLTEKFDVTIISPRNHFVYTPMLAGSAGKLLSTRRACCYVKLSIALFTPIVIILCFHIYLDLFQLERSSPARFRSRSAQSVATRPPISKPQPCALTKNIKRYLARA